MGKPMSALDEFPPGSWEAFEVGCICPMIDNRRGKGAYTNDDDKPVFWVNEDCPIHNNEDGE